MNQTYTWEFQCQYELQHYPFDTQVIKYKEFPTILIPQECKIEMTVESLSHKTVRLLADKVLLIAIL